MKRPLYLINIAPHYGGGEIYMSKLATLLAESHRVTVVSPYLHALFNKMEEIDVPVINLGNTSPIATRIGFLKWLLLNRRLVKDGAIVLLNGRSAAYLTPFVALISGAPPVVIAHTELTGKVQFKERLYALATCFAKKVICVSDTLAEQHRRRWPRVPAVGIPNWLDGGRAARAPVRSMPRAGVDIAVIGRLEANKGMADVISACAGIPNVNLHIFGDGPLRHSLESMVSPEQSVCFHGFVDDMPARLLNHAILVSASRTESFSYAVGEAIEAGLLCVVSDIPAHRELLGGSYPSTLFFAPGNSTGVQQAITLAITMLHDANGESAATVIHAAQLRIATRNSPSTARNAYQRELDDCLK